MSEKELSTLQVILITGKNEFLEKGYLGASLRNIAREALVKEQYDTFLSVYCRAQTEFAGQPDEKQLVSVGEISGQCMEELLAYAYDHLDVFRLILCCSEGTKYAGLIDEMVDIEMQATHDYVKVLRRSGKAVPDIDPVLEHILITGMFNAFFEMIIHQMPREQAEVYLREMRTFYTAGWFRIMGLQ